FELPEVLAGDFTAKLQHGQGALALYGTASGKVEPGKRTEIRVALQPSGEIRGTVSRPAAPPLVKRPAFGAEVRILLLTEGGGLRAQFPPLLVQDDGTFSVKGVPQGRFAIRVFDPISNGRAVLDGLHLDGPLAVVPEILIDDQPPAPVFVQPARDSVQRRFGG